MDKDGRINSTMKSDSIVERIIRQTFIEIREKKIRVEKKPGDNEMDI